MNIDLSDLKKNMKKYLYLSLSYITHALVNDGENLCAEKRQGYYLRSFLSFQRPRSNIIFQRFKYVALF